MAPTREIRFPVDSLLALRRALIRQLGAEAAARALQEVGHAAGDALFRRLGEGDELAHTPSETFWQRLAAVFRELGWGTLEHRSPHPGVGALVARDWFEVEEDTDHPDTPFTTGVLANLLGRTAGQDVAVLQVPCEDREPGCVRFLFGAPSTLDRLYDGLREGRDVQAGLGALG